MKQTIEEAAQSMAYNKMLVWGGLPALAKKYFIKGAEWQSKQSPWISVKDKAGCDSSNDCIVMVMNGDVFRAYFSSKDKWIKKNGGSYDEVIDDVVAWMPIHSFDEILEANKDVLERLNRKEIDL